MEVSDSWPYLATPRVVPMLKPTNPTVPPPLRNKTMTDGSYIQDSAIASSIHEENTPNVPAISTVAARSSSSSGEDQSFMSSDFTKLLLFAAAACGAIILVDISAKTFMSKK